MAPKKRTTRSTPATPTTTTSVTNEQLRALINQGVADALAARDADRSMNGDDSHNSGTGVRRTERVARECTYQDFMKCQPLFFKGTEGVIELTQWFERMETVFRISNCTVENQVKFATCTLLGVALTWWNSHVRTVGHDVAYAMTWTDLKKKMTDKMFPEESDKIERYVGGLPGMIHGSVVASKPITMQDATEMATELMDKKISLKPWEDAILGPCCKEIDELVMVYSGKRRVLNSYGHSDASSTHFCSRTQIGESSRAKYQEIRNRSRFGINKWYQSFALRNFDLEDMELESTNSGPTAKLPILKLGEYEMWAIRIKQYFQIQDYALWEVIENGDSCVSIKRRQRRKNDVKARGLLLMALPNEHQLTFSQYPDAKSMFAAIETRFGVVWMNKPEIETMSIDDLYNNFKIVEQKIKKTVGTSSGVQNLAFMTAPSSSSTNDANTASYKFMLQHIVLILRFHQVALQSVSANTVNSFHGVQSTKKQGRSVQKSRQHQEARKQRRHFQGNVGIDGEVLIWSDMAKEQVSDKHALMRFRLRGRMRFFFREERLMSLKREVGIKQYEINTLKTEFEKLKQEKDAIDFKIEKFGKASKDLDQLFVKEPEFKGYSLENSKKESNVGKPQHDDKGFVDSGCSRHMTGNIAYLSDFKQFDGGYVAFGGGAYGGKISGKGTLKNVNLDFEDVYFVNELKFNLFSVSQMCDKKNYDLFTDTECLVLSLNFKLPDENQILLKVPRNDNMYSFDMKNYCS
ncbi:hypothetical protein Tco_0588898 [Tanacetum coccineum]